MINKYQSLDGTVYMTSSRSPEQLEKLPSGVYSFEVIDSMFETEVKFETVSIKEKYVVPSSGLHNDIISKITDYFTPEVKDIHRKLGVSHKLGMILHGHHGTGKTVLAQIIGEKLVKDYDAIVLWADERVVDIHQALTEIRKRDPEKLIVVLYDEFEDLVSMDENPLLTFLDGVSSPENFVFIGITNYLDQIPARIKERKSRIKYLHHLDKMDLQVYREFIEEKLALFDKDTSEIEKLAQTCYKKKLTLDETKHFLIDAMLSKV